ncbi:MAG: hypothetical protein MUC79_02110 [Thiobacillaceae bacterium]|jgi:hypothetical protein|nr:hypothetical protein [Thiobacillaceae bacterium]
MTARQRLYGFLALLALMAVTRVGHFGTAISLPDASLAVFLLGGLWLGGAIFFLVLLAAVFGIDVYLAQTATAAGWCLTPAYWGLLPTYAVMWLAGRWLARREDSLRAAPYVATSVAAVGAAFLISNASFWAFSGYFGEMAPADYAQAVARYFPPYLGGAALYLGLGWLVGRLLVTRNKAVAA